MRWTYAASTAPVVAAPPLRPGRRPVDLGRRVAVPLREAAVAVRWATEEVVGRDTLARLGVELVGGTHLARPVRIGFGPLLEEDDALVLPVWWEDAEHPRLFPTFDGGIELRGDDRGTEIRLVGSYQAPLGPIGHFADGIGHRIVTASLETFLAGVAGRLVVAATAAQNDF